MYWLLHPINRWCHHSSGVKIPRWSYTKTNYKACFLHQKLRTRLESDHTVVHSRLVKPEISFIPLYFIFSVSTTISGARMLFGDKKRRNNCRFYYFFVVSQMKPHYIQCMLGITMIDLYPQPSWNFVFGLALPEQRAPVGGVGVFSFARQVFFLNSTIHPKHKR